MASARADQVRALIATRIAAEVPTLAEMAEPYFLAKAARSPVPNTFCVGIGRSVGGKDRQSRSEGTQAHTGIKVLIALQLEHADHLTGETTIGQIRNAIAVALVADWSADVEILWIEDAEVTASATLIWFESQFLAIHQLPLE